MERLIYRTRGGYSRVKRAMSSVSEIPGRAMIYISSSAAESMMTPAITRALSVIGKSSTYHSQAATGDSPWLPRGP